MATYTYMDSQNLYHKYGNTASITNNGGEYKTYGPTRTVEIKVDLSTLVVGNTIINDAISFPKNVFVESVVIDADVITASSGSGTFDVGLIDNDRSTVKAQQGFIAAEVPATFGTTAGKSVTYTTGTSKAGTLIGTTNANIGYLMIGIGTAVFQTGTLHIRINYRAAN